MGLLDKVKDFLDDGKINGSVNSGEKPEPKQAAPAAQPAPKPVQQQKPAEETLPPDRPISVTFGSPSPVPYRSEDRSVFLRYAGTAEVVPLKEGYTLSNLGTIVRSNLVSLMNVALANASAKGIAIEKLPAHFRDIEQEVLLGFEKDDLKLINVRLVNIA